MNQFRPWGDIDWLLHRLGPRTWSFLGCCGTEARSVALPIYLGRDRLDGVQIVSIVDPDPLDARATEDRLRFHATELMARGYSETEIKRANLLADLEEIHDVVSNLRDGGAKSLLIDITSLPKRWFFVVIQAALRDNAFEDVVVTYTSGNGYAEQLSENISPLQALPGFFADDGRSKHNSIIVGIGFEPSGLVPLLSDHQAEKIRLIFPFPPGPPGHRRNWMFVKQIEDLAQLKEIQSPDGVHIHMYDCPQIFEALIEMTANGTETSALAPYGPKTVSLAMCLFSVSAAAAGRPRVPVFYAQPLRYAIDYTAGVKALPGQTGTPDVKAYCIRLGGRDLYSLS